MTFNRPWLIRPLSRSATLTGAVRNSKRHVGNMLTKLRLRDRTQAVVYAYENGLAA